MANQKSSISAVKIAQKVEALPKAQTVYKHSQETITREDVLKQSKKSPPLSADIKFLQNKLQKESSNSQGSNTGIGNKVGKVNIPKAFQEGHKEIKISAKPAVLPKFPKVLEVGKKIIEQRNQKVAPLYTSKLAVTLKPVEKPVVPPKPSKIEQCNRSQAPLYTSKLAVTLKPVEKPFSQTKQTYGNVEKLKAKFESLHSSKESKPNTDREVGKLKIPASFQDKLNDTVNKNNNTGKGR